MKFEPGDHLRIHRGGYHHDVIHVTDGWVIHFWAPRGKRGASIRLDRGSQMYAAQTPPSAYGGMPSASTRPRSFAAPISAEVTENTTSCSATANTLLPGARPVSTRAVRCSAA